MAAAFFKELVRQDSVQASGKASLVSCGWGISTIPYPRILDTGLLD